jgi:hypothetical protein
VHDGRTRKRALVGRREAPTGHGGDEVDLVEQSTWPATQAHGGGRELLQHPVGECRGPGAAPGEGKDQQQLIGTRSRGNGRGWPLLLPMDSTATVSSTASRRGSSNAPWSNGSSSSSSARATGCGSRRSTSTAASSRRSTTTSIFSTATRPGSAGRLHRRLRGTGPRVRTDEYAEPWSSAPDSSRQPAEAEALDMVSR